MSVIVTRSPLRLMAHVVLAVPAVLLAVDMTISHRFYGAPEATERVTGSTIDEFGQVVQVTERELTDAGRKQANRDRALAAILFVGGVTSMGWAMRDLVSPRPLLRGDDDGLAVRIDSGVRPMVAFSWDDIAEVRSGLVDVDGEALPALSVRLADPDALPIEPASATVDPPWLHLIADDWDPPAHMVAPLLEQASPHGPASVDDG